LLESAVEKVLGLFVYSVVRSVFLYKCIPVQYGKPHISFLLKIRYSIDGNFYFELFLLSTQAMRIKDCEGILSPANKCFRFKSTIVANVKECIHFSPIFRRVTISFGISIKFLGAGKQKQEFK